MANGIYQQPLSLISFDYYAVHVCDRAGLPIWFFLLNCYDCRQIFICFQNTSRQTAEKIHLHAQKHRRTEQSDLERNYNIYYIRQSKINALVRTQILFHMFISQATVSIPSVPVLKNNGYIFFIAYIDKLLGKSTADDTHRRQDQPYQSCQTRDRKWWEHSAWIRKLGFKPFLVWDIYCL